MGWQISHKHTTVGKVRAQGRSVSLTENVVVILFWVSNTSADSKITHEENIT